MRAISHGNIYDIYDDSLKTYDKLPALTYVVRFSQNRGFYLEKYVEMEITESKIYGVHIEKVLKVLNSFEKVNRSLGVILSGDKGIGKSLFAKLLAIEALKKGIPLIVVDTYELEGKKIFTFGGASSHDIDGGILELAAPDFEKKKQELDKGWKPYRINHLSWWKEEVPSEEEMNEGRKNLLNHENKVDFIVTHCASSNTVALLSHGMYEPDVLTDYLEEIRQKVEFKKGFFGHYHDNRNVNAKEILLWEQIIRIV